MSDSVVHVGNKVDKTSCENVSKAIERILETGFKTHASQDTIQAAISALSTAFAVNGTVITGCSIEGDKTMAQ